MVDGGFGGDLTEDHHHAGFDASLARNFSVGIDTQMSVKNGVGNLETRHVFF